MPSSESLLISSVIRTKDHISVVSSGLTIDMFHVHKQEWKWISQYVATHRKTPSRSAFRSRFSQFTIYKSDDTPYLIEQVKEDHTRYLLVELLEDTAEKLRQGDTASSVLGDVTSSVRRITSSTHSTQLSNSDIITSWEDIYNDAVRRVVRAKEHGLPGIPTGFDSLDISTGGVQPGHLWVVAARLGKGKTWTAVRLATTSLMEGFTPLYFSLEQSRASVAFRVHTFLSAVYNHETFRNLDLNKGENLSLLEYKKFLRSLKKYVQNRPFYVADSTRGRITPEMVAAHIESTKPDIVFIDYLTLMAREADWQGVSALIGEIKSVAEQYQVPTVVLSQVNRGAANKGIPSVDDLSLSDSVGQDADAVVTLARMSEHVVKMKLAKFRHGIDGMTWFAEFDVNNGRYLEISGDEAERIKELDGLDVD